MFRVFLIFFTLITLLVTGCTNSQEDGQDSYDLVRETAYKFVQQNNWDNTIEGDWTNAEVKKIVASRNVQFIDSTYQGKEVLAVSFKDKPNATTGTPVILVEPVNKKVIGYIPSE